MSVLWENLESNEAGRIVGRFGTECNTLLLKLLNAFEDNGCARHRAADWIILGLNDKSPTRNMVQQLEADGLGRYQ